MLAVFQVATGEVWAGKTVGNRAAQGLFLYQQFNTVVILQQNRRQGGADQQSYRDLLSRLRSGMTTTEDWHILRARSMLELAVEERQQFESDECTNLYSTNADVLQHNLKRLKGLERPIALVLAEHSSSAAANASAST